MKGLKTWPNTYFERRRPVLDLNAAIRERHSTRMFLLQQPVPRALVDEALALAQLAPSNTADGTESEAKILRCHDSNNREAGFPVFYRCCAPDLPVGDSYSGRS